MNFYTSIIPFMVKESFLVLISNVWVIPYDFFSNTGLFSIACFSPRIKNIFKECTWNIKCINILCMFHKKNSSPTNYVTYELIDDGAGGYKKIYKGRDVIRNAYGLIECYIE